jgi:hypothetical protein
VVARIDRQTITQPAVRLLADETGRRVDPFELDLTKDEATISGLGSREGALA